MIFSDNAEKKKFSGGNVEKESARGTYIDKGDKK